VGLRARSQPAGSFDRPGYGAGYSDSYADRARLFGLSGLARTLLSELRILQLARELAELSTPVLQIWGRHDRLVPPRHLTQSVGAVVLPGCGHCPQLDAPDLLLDTVLPFLTAHAAGPDALPQAAGT
jgi:pimeloyl-ACP methyl ester carboxylesterase